MVSKHKRFTFFEDDEEEDVEEEKKQPCWVMITRFIPVEKGLDIRKMDIYWAYDFEKQSRGFNNYSREIQKYLISIRTPNDDRCKVWSGECSEVSKENLELYLREGAYLPIHLNKRHTSEKQLDFDEETRDIIGSLQLDGMSYSEAINELISNGEIEGKMIPPNHFYRLIPEYQEYFTGDIYS